MNNYNVVELLDGLKVIDEVSVGVMTKCEKELGKPFPLINWMYLTNEVKIIKIMANEVKGQDFTDEDIIDFLDKERRENGDLGKVNEFFNSIFEEKKKMKKRQAKRKGK